MCHNVLKTRSPELHNKRSGLKQTVVSAGVSNLPVLAAESTVRKKGAPISHANNIRVIKRLDVQGQPHLHAAWTK